MAQWRYKPVGSFPPEFHRALEKGVCKDHPILTVHTRMRAQRMQIEWRLFRYALSREANHPLARVTQSLTMRTTVARNTHSGLWELRLTARESFEQDLKKII